MLFQPLSLSTLACSSSAGRVRAAQGSAGEHAQVSAAGLRAALPPALRHRGTHRAPPAALRSCRSAEEGAQLQRCPPCLARGVRGSPERKVSAGAPEGQVRPSWALTAAEVAKCEALCVSTAGEGFFCTSVSRPARKRIYRESHFSSLQSHLEQL